MPPVKLFFTAAIPGVISMFAMSIYNIVEGIFVGQFIGGDAFAAMNLAMPLVFITFALSDMVGVGSSVLISIAHGQKNEKRANNIFSCSVILIVSTAIVFPLIMVVVLWPLGLDGLWLNQAATYVPVGIIAFVMLRRTQKSLALHIK